MRIISGKYKGRRLQAPKNAKVRPTTDFAKESLFNILENQIDLDGLKVLDLFAGYGGIALEFLSRGADHVTSVDIQIASAKTMNKYKKEIGIDNWTILKRNCFQWLKQPHETYDLVFADPPYDHKDILKIPELVDQQHYVTADGLLIVEHSKTVNFSDSLNFVKTRSYGKVNFSFFQKNK